MSLADGLRWEAAAAAHLERHGLSVLARGYRCRLGELDLVCRDGATLVVVEVRARSSRARGTAAETVGPNKQRRIVQATRHWLMSRREWHDAAVRFDVVAFDSIDTPTPTLQWYRSAFDAT